MDVSLLDLPLGAVMDVVKGFVFVLFVASAILLTVVILLQEGKGGGLGGAFGGAAADAFGVKAGTVNRFTAYVAASFLGLALLYAGFTAAGERRSLDIAPPAIDGPSDSPAVPDVLPPPPAEGPSDAGPGGDEKPAEAPSDGGAPAGEDAGSGAPEDGGAGQGPGSGGGG